MRAARNRIATLSLVLSPAAAILACDSPPGAPRSDAAVGAAGGCRDYVTADGYTCCCGQPFCTRNLVGGCAHDPESTIVASSGATGSGGTMHSDAGGSPGSVDASSPSGGRPTSSGSPPVSTGGRRGSGGSSSNDCTSHEGEVVLDDGGIIVLANGVVIELDKECPDVSVEVLAVKCGAPLGFCGVMPSPLTLPGCCQSDGTCGARTPCTSDTLRGVVPPEGCLRYTQLSTSVIRVASPPNPVPGCAYRPVPDPG